MQIKLYTIPILDSGEAEEEMNVFLKSHRILSVQQELLRREQEAYWCISIRYVEGSKSRSKSGPVPKEKIDYREILGSETFRIYDRLRKCRKQLAEKNGVPIYAVFLNVELAAIAKMPELLYEKLQEIEGIGVGKLEKYGKRLLEMYHTKAADEKSEQTHS